MEEIRKYEDTQYSKEEWDLIVDFLNNILVSAQGGYNTIDEIATKIKTIETTRTSAFANEGGGDQAIDETKNVHRSGKTWFGEQNGVRLVEINGDFEFKNIIDGVTYCCESGEDLLAAAGVDPGLVKGFIIFSKNGDDLHYLLIGDSSGLTNVTAPLSMGVICLSDFTKYARTTVSKDINGHYFIQAENGIETRHRKTPFAQEFHNPLIFQKYGTGLIKEGIVIDANTTVATPEYLFAIGSDKTVSEIPVSFFDRKAPFGGRFNLNLDTWVTFAPYYPGASNPNHTSAAGTGINPTNTFNNLGVGYFSEGTILKRLELFGSVSNTDATDVLVYVDIIHETTVDAGFSSTSDSTRIEVLSPTSIKNGAVDVFKEQLFTVDLSDYVLPKGAAVRVYFKAVGAIGGLRYFGIDANLIYQEKLPKIIV